MTPERWRQIEALYELASERAPGRREELFVGVEPELRNEVESLLARRSMPTPLDRPAWENLPGTIIRTIGPGAQLGPYRIEERIGAGGMGEVFRGIDIRLGRPVAIKISRQISRERFGERFEREARAISALNHPHICTMHDIGSQDGVGYVVMEYVEGKPLQGPLPIPEALRLAIQIAGALEAAHEKGILHRDLKPGNILVAKGGIKLLDFGLAKFVRAAPQTEDTTQTASLTDTGQIVGTPAYMSPEQIEGKALDARSDIFSFGLVVYEMLAGRRAFAGASQQGTMAAILRGVPAPLPAMPPALERTVMKCLAKDPGARWQTAADMRHELEWIAAGEVTRPRKTARRLVPWLAGAAALALVGTGYFRLHAAPKLTDKDMIVLADFENKTGDEVFDGALRQGLSIQLEQSPFLSMVSDERIQGALQTMAQPADTRLNQKIARDVCIRTGSAAVIGGSIARLGTQYVLGLSARNCGNGEILDEEQEKAAKKEDVLDALSRMAGRFRSRVGESLATVEKHSKPLSEDTTFSLDALKAYSQGLNVLAAQGDAAGISWFQRAVDFDPGFAMAYARLGLAYGDVGEATLATDNFEKARQFRKRASDREQFFIDASYDIHVTGNLERAEQACEAWEQTYPRDPGPPGFLSAMIYVIIGKYPRALEESKKLVAIDPNFAIGYLLVSFNDVYMNRIAESDQVLKEAAARKLEMPELALQRYFNAFLKGDPAGMAREVALARGKREYEDWLSEVDAFSLAYSGQLQKALSQAQRAADLARQGGRKERAAGLEAGPALWDAFLGNAAAAKRRANDMLDLSRDRDVEYGAALALALAGDSAAAEKLARDLQGRFREDTAVRSSYLPVIEAVLALNRHEPGKAVQVLEGASAYELGTPPSGALGFFGILYPVYVRGLAYLDAHQGAQAASEFRNVIAHRNIVWNDPIGALAHRQLGKALAMSGDVAGARAAYDEFFALWKDADQDISILRDAKREYALL